MNEMITLTNNELEISEKIQEKLPDGTLIRLGEILQGY